jgi:tetratricopeptide (TPR) repeat protein
MDEAPPVRSPDGRLLHSCALNNLGAACQDDGRMEQALQYFASAVALNPRCNLSLKNRANLHLTHAEALQRSANVPALVPPQHELSYGYYGKSLEQDWHLPVVFPVAHGVLVRLDARITSQFEEPSDKLGRNVSYHFTTNLTHATSAHV